MSEEDTPTVHDEHHIRHELASALTHGVGAMAALAGSAVLITLAALHGDAWQLGASIDRMIDCALRMREQAKGK